MGVLVGCPREVKPGEHRVAITPSVAEKLVEAGHMVNIEKGAGEGAGFPDGDYRSAGANIVSTSRAWQVDLCVKMKEPTPSEYGRLEGNVLFSALHLAVEPELARSLCDARTMAIAMESVSDDLGRYPILAPLSHIAGKVAVQIGANERLGMGGTLLCGSLGSRPAFVVIVGAGSVGRAAAEMAHGMGANVAVLDRDEDLIYRLESEDAVGIDYLVATQRSLTTNVACADLLIGATAVNGERAVPVVTEEMVRLMARGSVIVDVSIDQGGCVETSMPTTWYEPVHDWNGIRHIGISNLPGMVPKTASMALSNSAGRYILALADSLGVDGTIGSALRLYPGISTGLYVAEGEIVHSGIRDALGSL